MRGHENIIAMRLSGRKPAGSVWLCDYPVASLHLDWHFSDDCKNPTVCTAGDRIDELDFRFLVDLQVFIQGESTSRVKALAAACRKASAERVVASAPGRHAMWQKGDVAWLSF